MGGGGGGVRGVWPLTIATWIYLSPLYFLLVAIGESGDRDAEQ